MRLICVLLLTGIAARAQEPIRAFSREVGIDVTVQNKRTGERLDGLSASDFEVFDDGKPVSQLRMSGAVGPPQPLTLAIVVDFLNWRSMPSIQSALHEAFRRLRPGDQVGVFRSLPGTELVQPLTHDAVALDGAVARIVEFEKAYREQRLAERASGKKRKTVAVGEAAYGMTNALADAARYLRSQRPRGQVQIIAITPDIALISAQFVRDTEHFLLGADAQVSALVHVPGGLISGVKTTMHVVYMRPDLRAVTIDEPVARLAGQTGGSVVGVKEGDFDTGLEKLLGIVTNRYLLSFTPREDRLDDRFHELKVRLTKSSEKVEIRSRRGYYAWKNPGPLAAVSPAPTGDLPVGEGVFYRSTTSWIPLAAAQVASISASGTTRFLLTGGLAGVRLTQLFANSKARARIAEAQPTFLLQSRDQPSAVWFVPVEIKGDHREVQTRILTDPKTRIAAQIGRSPEGSTWISPGQPLAPGEYLVTLDAALGAGYDFGVDLPAKR